MATRNVTQIQDFADVLTEIGGGWRTTFVYMNIARFRKTGQAVDMNGLSSSLDADTDLDQGVSGSLRDFVGRGNKRNNRFPYAGVVKVAKYTVNWQTAKKHKESYDNFVSRANPLAAKYAAMALKRQGLPLTQDALDSVEIKSRDQMDYERQEAGLEPGKDFKTKRDRKDYKTLVNYGRGGMWVRPNDLNKRGEERVVIPQNMSNLSTGGTHYYLINDDGSIAGGKAVSLDTIQHILSPKKTGDPGKVRELRKLGANDEEIEQYIKEFNQLKWNEMDFLADMFLYIVASSTDEFHGGNVNKVIFFNKDLVDRLTNSDHDFAINPNDFMAIAKNEIQSTYGIQVETKKRLFGGFKQMIKEGRKMKNVIRITESDVRRMVNETIRRLRQIQ